MRQSIREYLRAVLHWWWVVTIGVLAGAVTYTFNLLDGVTVPIWVWIAVALLGLIVAQFLAFHGLRLRRDEIKTELDNIKNARPRISVKPKVHNNRFILEVCNHGGEADFTAKGRVTSGIPEPELYTMYWESVPTIYCHIDGGGGRASILVAKKAERTMLRDAKTSIYEGDLALLKMGTSGEQVFPARSYVETKQIRDGKEVIRGTLEDKCIIEVAITSSPQLAKPFDLHQYLIEFDQQRNLVFTEVSTSNKGHIV